MSTSKVLGLGLALLGSSGIALTLPIARGCSQLVAQGAAAQEPAGLLGLYFELVAPINRLGLGLPVDGASPADRAMTYAGFLVAPRLLAALLVICGGALLLHPDETVEHENANRARTHRAPGPP